MLVGVQVVDPELLGPGFLGCWFAVEEKDVGLDALGVEDSGGAVAARGERRLVSVTHDGLFGAFGVIALMLAVMV